MHVIDSHTGGEPTRVILDGGPDLGDGPLAERAQKLATEYEEFYKSLLREPRGQPAMVAALLTEPRDINCATGVIYFDVAAVIGMCGHGTIGLGVTLYHWGKIGLGCHRIETPVGVVEINLLDPNRVQVTNVESYVVAKDVQLDLPDYGPVKGMIAYGGNMFFILEEPPIAVEKSNIPPLTILAKQIETALSEHDISAQLERPVDHIILQQRHGASSDIFARNFVLCPDGTFDRSPCGTGCSALLACLADNNELEEGQEIMQESIIGSTYCLSYQKGQAGGIIPTITGQAWVTAQSTIRFDDTDPFKSGIDYEQK